MIGREFGRFPKPLTAWIKWRHVAPFVLAFAVAGCARTIPFPRPITAESTARLTFYGLRSYASTKGVRVSGSVRRPPLALGPLWGHIHVVATFADGPPVSVDTIWGGNLSKGARSAWFSATIPTTSPDRLTTISVSYRPKRD